MRRLGKRAFLVFLLLAASVGPGFSHARLVRSNPSDGAVLPAPPRVVRAWFNEELDPSASRLEVVDARGRVVARGGVDLGDLDRRTLVVRVGRLGPGAYTVRWTAVSADDGYVARGRFRFTVQPRGPYGSLEGVPASSLPSPLLPDGHVHKVRPPFLPGSAERVIHHVSERIRVLHPDTPCAVALRHRRVVNARELDPGG